MKKTGKIYIVCILAAIFFVLPGVFTAYSDIYKYRDKNGVLHFSNMPDSPKYRLYIRQNPATDNYLHSTEKYDDYLDEAARAHGIDFPLLKAIVKVESDFNPKAVSKKGALGLMQIMPENLERLRISDPFDPLENIMGGASYFRQLLTKYEGKLYLAIAAYNAGPGAVDRYNRIPPYKETEDYVEKVIKYYKIFKAG